MDRKRQKLTPEMNDVQNECQDAKITALERKLEHMENKLKVNDAQKECQDEKITALDRKLEHMENKLKLVIAELEQVKEERARDKINFETAKCELESKIDKYKEQCTELQIENKRLLTYLQDLESANINAEEKSQIILYNNTDLKSQITKVNESIDNDLDINSLPDEVIVEVFSYLEQNELGQISRVCRRWNELTKDPLLWKKVNVRIFSSDRKNNTVAESFINGLPSCVTFIRLEFLDYEEEFVEVHFEKLCMKLHQKCSHLEELILTGCGISNILPVVINFCTLFLQGVKKLVFHHCSFRDYSGTVEFNDTSKIEVLDLYCCDFFHSSKIQFSKLPYLKQLRLYLTNVDDTWFKDDTSFLNQLDILDLGWTSITDSTFHTIQRHGLNLRELYLCSDSIADNDLNVNNSVFPHLKTICLADTYVTCDSVVSLIQSCPSLENVYVDADVAVSFAVHPFVAANTCKSGIVKAIRNDHDHNVDYSHT